MSPEPAYAELEVHIHRREAQGYPVEITVNRPLESRRGSV